MRSLVVVAVLAVSVPAFADPPPSAVSEPVVVPIKRETLEIIMAEAATAEPTRQLLLQCQADAAKLAAKEPEPASWWTGMKWAGIGALVIGAFAAGVWVGH